MSEKEALSLVGGVKGILKRMVVDVRASLLTLNYHQIKRLEIENGIEDNTLFKIREGKEEIDKELFRVLKYPFGLSFKKVVNKEKLIRYLDENKEIKEIWENEAEDKQMRLAASGGMSAGGQVSVQLVDYIILRAMGEFYKQMKP